MDYKNVFISYAKEDINYAERLYDFLISKNYNPWLDKKKLYAGQDWNFFIQDALKKADFIIVILSKISTSKRGYVQREFKQVLEFCEYKLDSDIYVIPLKIDDCEVPMNLQKFQWIEYDANAFEQIAKSIEIQRSSLLNVSSFIEFSNKSIELFNHVKQGEYGGYSPKHLYEFHFPQFELSIDESLIELNSLIQNDVLINLLEVRANYYNYLLLDGTENALDSENPEDSTSYGKIEIEIINPQFVSFTSFTSEYFTGTAHGLFGTKGHNYLINPVRKFSFINLFNDQANYLYTIRDLVHEKLMVIALKSELYYSIEEDSEEVIEMSPEDKQNAFYIYDHGLLPIEENFNNYFFKENSIIFIYNPYEITAWSQGDHFPEVTFTELANAFPTEHKLIKFLGNV